MSATFPMLSETLFPDAVDAMTRMEDLGDGDLVLVGEYYRLYNAGNLAAAKQLIQSNPQLVPKIFNAQHFNQIKDAVVALEQYFKACSFTQVLGPWDAGGLYQLGDIVSHKNTLWQAQGGSSGSEPSETNPDWKKILFLDVSDLDAFFATQAQVDAGAATDKALNPSHKATTQHRGTTQYADATAMEAGSSEELSATPKGVKAAIDKAKTEIAGDFPSIPNVPDFASQTQVNNGTPGNVMLNPTHKATTTNRGTVRIATEAETLEGTLGDAVASPKGIAYMVGKENGLAGLDSGGKLPTSVIPGTAGGQAGDIQLTMRPSMPAGWLPCDGGMIKAGEWPAIQPYLRKLGLGVGWVDSSMAFSGVTYGEVAGEKWWVATVGNDGDGQRCIYYKKDTPHGTWTKKVIGDAGNHRRIMFANGYFVVVTNSAYFSSYSSSIDYCQGAPTGNWTSSTFPMFVDAFEYANGYFAAGGSVSSGSTFMYRAGDPTGEWTKHPDPGWTGREPRAIAFANNYWVLLRQAQSGQSTNLIFYIEGTPDGTVQSAPGPAGYSNSPNDKRIAAKGNYFLMTGGWYTQSPLSAWTQNPVLASLDSPATAGDYWFADTAYRQGDPTGAFSPLAAGVTVGTYGIAYGDGIFANGIGKHTTDGYQLPDIPGIADAYIKAT